MLNIDHKLTMALSVKTDKEWVGEFSSLQYPDKYVVGHVVMKEIKSQESDPYDTYITITYTGNYNKGQKKFMTIHVNPKIKK